MENKADAENLHNKNAKHLVLITGVIYFILVTISIIVGLSQKFEINPIQTVFQILVTVLLLWGIFSNRPLARRFILFSTTLIIISVPLTLYQYFFNTNSSYIQTTIYHSLRAGWFIAIELIYLIAAILIIYILMRTDVRTLFSNHNLHN